MPDFRQAVKLNGIPVVGLVPYSNATAPSSPVDGQLWYDNVNELLKSFNATTTAWVICELGAGVIVDSMVASGAAVAESKLSLATDAAAGTGSRRTIGTGALQAMAGNTTLHGVSLTANDGDVALNSHKLTGLTDPGTSTSQDAATANWVTNAIQAAINGQDWKDSVDLATAAALPANTYSAGVLTATGTGVLPVDGQNVSAGQRILVKNEVTGSHNGIYVVTNAGGSGISYILTRAADANTSALMGGGTTVPVDSGGTVNAGTVWLLVSLDAIVLDTTSLTFTQIGAAGTSYTAGAGITLTGNVFSLTTPVTVALGGTNATTAAGARTSLGAAGLYNTGTIGDGSATVLTVTHNLNNAIPQVQVWDVSGANPIRVECDITSTSVNAVTLGFATAPASNSIKAVVQG